MRSLIEQGYIEQAGTVVSAMFEIAWTAVYVSRDAAAAERWTRHNDPKRPAFSAWQACLEGLRLLGHPEPDKQVRAEYEIYRRLCWCKHGSPLTAGGITAEFVLAQAERLAALVHDRDAGVVA
ncbi:MAG TPA: hypothetical protein VFL57_09325 [Bryobacteraceae bacterium]|nr:hypothetical protein [Bryobacteraceae bacterium]